MSPCVFEYCVVQIARNSQEIYKMRGLLEDKAPAPPTPQLSPHMSQQFQPMQQMAQMQLPHGMQMPQGMQLPLQFSHMPSLGSH